MAWRSGGSISPSHRTRRCAPGTSPKRPSTGGCCGGWRHSTRCRRPRRTCSAPGPPSARPNWPGRCSPMPASSVVVDTGYPDPAGALGRDDFARASGAERADLLRLELLFQDLVAGCASYGELTDAVRHRLADVRGSGYAGFKSIAGYRTGLAIRRWPADEARAAYRAARDEVVRCGSVRLGYQPLLDTLLHVAFEAAAAQELPVQFHVGYGDPDADLRAAAPLELRDVLSEPGYRLMPVVLLHGCWPYVREGAYLAAVYGNVYLDLSFAIPFLSVAEMTSMARAAVGTAPATKLMYSSDGARVPELHWAGAHDGRRVLGEVLGELVSDGDLSLAEARQAGERILRGNARRVYGLTGRPRR